MALLSRKEYIMSTSRAQTMTDLETILEILDQRIYEYSSAGMRLKSVPLYVMWVAAYGTRYLYQERSVEYGLFARIENRNKTS